MEDDRPISPSRRSDIRERKLCLQSGLRPREKTRTRPRAIDQAFVSQKLYCMCNMGCNYREEMSNIAMQKCRCSRVNGVADADRDSEDYGNKANVGKRRAESGVSGAGEESAELSSSCQSVEECLVQEFVCLSAISAVQAFRMRLTRRLLF